MNKVSISENLRLIDYNVIRRIEEHAKKYDETFDKKEFLKNVSAYEQKVILLNSLKPYEVLNYLDELDLKSSRLVIEELTKEEIMEILELFTSEDKKKFYKTFSNLDIVNQFIKYDNNSCEHVQALTYDRKIDLLESTKKETSKASSILYNSMSIEEKNMVVELIESNDYDGSISNLENVLINENTNNDLENISEVNEEAKEELEEQEIIEDIEKQNQENLLKEKNCFIVNNFDKYINSIPEFKEMNIDSNDFYSILSIESRKIIDADFELYLQDKNNNKTEQENIEFYDKYAIIGNGEKKVSTVSNDFAVNEFNELKNKCENEEINMYINKMIKENEEQNIKIK